ncbi:MAG: F0F1 ATP synthase subunit epsilon [Alphaproteobacteria bacterium]|nr:F0F1 ATP synthase subunit epsilon [Alphaproteobacteria bacterium]
MIKTLDFELILPGERLFSGSVARVIVLGEDGEFTILPGHSLLVSLLRPGLLSVEFIETDKSEGMVHRFFVRGGFFEARPDKVVILAEQAVPLEYFSPSLLEEEIIRAEREKEATADGGDDKSLAWRHVEDLKRLRPLLSH